MTDEYRLERISPENLGDFIAIARDAFQRECSRDECEGLFATAAWGRSYIGYLAYHRETDEPAGFYGIFPCAAEFNGREILIAQSGSTMTHSRHRRKGLFFKLATETFDLARREGIAFVYGFPNLGTSHPGLMKLGWTHDGELRSYHLFVPTIPLGHLAARTRMLRPIYEAWVSFITGFWRVEPKPFESSVKEKGIGSLIHDHRFFGYKKESSERFMLRLSGRNVFVKQAGGVVGIGDIELGDDPERDLKGILRRLKAICFLIGCVQLRTYMSPGCRLDRLMTKIGHKPQKSLPNCYLELAERLPMERFKYVYADLDTF